MKDVFEYVLTYWNPFFVGWIGTLLIYGIIKEFIFLYNGAYIYLNPFKRLFTGIIIDSMGFWRLVFTIFSVILGWVEGFHIVANAIILGNFFLYIMITNVIASEDGYEDRPYSVKYKFKKVKDNIETPFMWLNAILILCIIISLII